MEKQILSEIYRIQEIMGFKKILNEFSIPGLSKGLTKALVAGADAEMTAAVKGLMDNTLVTGGKTIDNVYDDFISDLSKAADEKEIDDIIKKYIPDARTSVDQQAFSKIFDNLFSRNPDVFLRLSLESNFGNRIKVFEKIISSKGVTLEQAQTQFNILKNRVDELMNSEDGTLIQMGDEIKNSKLYSDFENKIKSLKDMESADAAAKASADLTNVATPTTWEQWYDDVYVVDAKKAGKKPISKKEFVAQAKSTATRIQGQSPEKIIKSLIETSPNKQNAIEYITNFFKKNKVGDGLEKGADGTIKLTEKGVNFIKTIGGIGVSGLIVVGVYLAIFKPEFYVDLSQRYKEAAAKYNEQYNILGERFGQKFYDLPNEVKDFLSSQFSVEEVTISKSSNYVKSFEFTPKTLIAAGNLTVTMQNGETKVFETNDDINFTLVEGTPPANNQTKNPSSITTDDIIDAIKNKGYTEPITLNPNENGKTNYTYKDSEGTEGSVTVDNNGIITVT